MQALVHMAINPVVQQKAYDELQSNLAMNDTYELSADLLSKSSAPYLHAILRESFRITPPLVIGVVKENLADDVEVHGVTFPKASAVFFLDTYSLGIDPNHVPDPDTFRPERWSEEEVLARKGTVAEVLDHPLYREPFSAGARKCPGSRVATYEVLVMLSQLLKDWKISTLDQNLRSWRDIEVSFGTTVQPKMPELVFEPRN